MREPYFFQVYKTTCGLVLAAGTEDDSILGTVNLSPEDSITSLSQHPNLIELFDEKWNRTRTLEAPPVGLAQRLGYDFFLAPIDEQQVWAAGVTYKNSQRARMAESKDGASHYDKVYNPSVRPELFFKCLPSHVCKPYGPIRMNRRSRWSTSEPELVMLQGVKRGFCVGNDFSARDIEGENPLYLPQAKTTDDCMGLGPCVTYFRGEIPSRLNISMTIYRGGQKVFAGETNFDQMNRTLDSLEEWLCEDRSFPKGVFLSTGTGIIPPDEFSHRDGDSVEVAIDYLGSIIHRVTQISI